MTQRASLQATPPCRLLRGKPVADDLLERVAADVAGLAGPRLRLVSITFGDSGAAPVYVRNQRRTAARVGIEFLEATFPSTMDESQALLAVQHLNADPSVTGIILQRPVPPHLSVKRLQGAIQPDKDVEGMHPESIGQIVYGLSDMGPCTALAAVELLRRTGLTIKGLEVVVIGHSEIVGKPLAFLLMAEGATVTVCPPLARSVMMHARRADAVFVAAGKPNLVGAEMIKPGAAVIDIGMNSVVDDGVSRVVGDVDFNAVREVAGWLTPAPGGVGPVTLAMLMRNTVFAARRQRKPRVGVAEESTEGLDRVILKDLVLSARIGIHAREMAIEQPLRINIELLARRGGDGWGVVDYETVANQVKNQVAATHIALVEDLAEALCAICLQDPRVRAATVRVEKPDAVAGAAGAGVEITRRAHS
jgi:methylenetetrahydrofolate dehydrogenase (NADP+)/methenyltetrahydrofolate cyclohydrolase